MKQGLSCEAWKESKRFSFELLLYIAISLVSMVFPYASYTYNKTVYTLTGFGFITGARISGGKVTVTTNIAVLLILISTAASIVILLLHKILTRRRQLSALCILAIVTVIANILFAMQLSSSMEGAKNAGVAYGSIISLAAGSVLTVRFLYVLWKNNVVRTLDFMVVPGLLYFFINNYIPMLGIVIAFKKVDYTKGILASPWVGLDNFKLLFNHTGSFFASDAFIITRNTLLYNLVFIILGIFFGILVGICLSDLLSRGLQKFFQTSILLPQLISMVIVAYIVYAFFSNEAGLINKMLGSNAVNFYTKPQYWPFILTFVFVWKQLGYNAIIFLSSIVGIDRSIYEAARVDGATRWQLIKQITIPMLKPTIITLFLLQVGRIFYSDFGLFYQVPLNSGMLYSVTNTVDTYVYRSLMISNNISVSSAASTYQAVVGFIIVMVVNLLVRKVDKDNALF